MVRIAPLKACKLSDPIVLPLDLNFVKFFSSQRMTPETYQQHGPTPIDINMTSTTSPARQRNQCSIATQYTTKKGGKLILYLISIILYSSKVIQYAYNTILYNRYWKKNNIPQQIMFLPHSNWSIVFVFVVSSFLAIHTSTTRDRRGTGTSQTMSKGTSLHQSAVAAVIVLQLAPNVPVFLINH